MSLSTPAHRRALSVSVDEMERRWTLAREAMAQRGIDVLLMRADADFLGGYLRYFTDIAAVAGIPTTAIFPRDDLMTLVRHGPPTDMEMPLAGSTMPGVKRILSHPSYTTLGYGAAEEVRLIARALRPYANGTIGLVGIHQLSWATVDRISREYPGARIVDAGDLVDTIRAVKSPEEQALIRLTAALQDEVIQSVFESVTPGMTERDLSAIARQASFLRGSEQGLYMCGSAPSGQPTLPMLPPNQTRVIEDGDLVCMLIENSGPGGYYTHIMRTCSVGAAPSQQMIDDLALCRQAQQRTIDMLVPGADPVEIYHMHNAFMREHDRPEETRNYCHAQGYDTLERPVFQPGETLRVQAGMNIGCHPSWVKGGVQMWICDNFLIAEDGPKRLHTFPSDIYQV